jgi:hypothetical protein
MVHVEFRRPGSEAGRSKCVATLTQRGRRPAQIEGAEPKVVDLERVVLSVSTGEAIRWEDDPEEWARSLSGRRLRYRTSPICCLRTGLPRPARSRC